MCVLKQLQSAVIVLELCAIVATFLANRDKIGTQACNDISTYHCRYVDTPYNALSVSIPKNFISTFIHLSPTVFYCNSHFAIKSNKLLVLLKNILHVYIFASGYIVPGLDYSVLVLAHST